jgi:hypothetical protein
MGKVIPSTWEGLPDVIKARFGTEAGRQRAMLHEGHLVLVTHVVPDADDVHRTAAIFWRNPSGQWKAAGAVKGSLQALKQVVEDYRKKGIELEKEMDVARSAADFFRVIHHASPLLRSARNLHKTLQDARDAIPQDPDLIALRDLASDSERTAELCLSDAKAGLDYTIARRAEEQAESAEHIEASSHRLNLIAALFLPVSAVGSVFGVNLMHGLETYGHPWLFWIFVLLSFVFGFIVRASINTPKKKRT